MREPLYETMLMDILDAVFSGLERIHRLKLENEDILSVSSVGVLLFYKLPRWTHMKTNELHGLRSCLAAKILKTPGMTMR